MKQYVRRILPALLLLTLVITMIGCSNAYSDAMNSAAQAGSLGSGDKIVVYNADKDEYVQKYFTENGLAKMPEEVGAVLQFSMAGSAKTRFVLIDASNGTVIGENGHR